MNENLHFIVEQTIAITYVDHMLLCQISYSKISIIDLSIDQSNYLFFKLIIFYIR